MVLTNMLPSQGNGAYTFHVYVRDVENQVVLLGSRTITCDNANATKPFGQIDTPAQGAVASGSSYMNFGWVLTQFPKFIPFDGSTVHVFIDGQPVGNVSYNHHRADIATLFPGLENSDGAVGFRAIDTTTMTNGTHTISWTATDSAGQVAGIGSRFFTVSNNGSMTAQVTPEPAPVKAAGSQAKAAGARPRTDRAQAKPDAAKTDAAKPEARVRPLKQPVSTGSALAIEAVDELPAEPAELAARSGWDLRAEWRSIPADASNRVVVTAEELERVELWLKQSADGTRYTGYQRVGSQLVPLPIGSKLEAESGQFTWAPGVGFIGGYDLVFVQWKDGTPVARRDVRVVLRPKKR
jgi:hypothetical protein